MTDLANVPAWPELRAITRADGTGELLTNGVSEPIEAANDTDARGEVIRRVSAVASKVDRPVRLVAEGPDGTWPIIVHADGHVDADPTTPPQPPTKPAESASVPETPATRTTAAEEAQRPPAAPPVPEVPAYVAAAATAPATPEPQPASPAGTVALSTPEPRRTAADAP